MTNTLSQTPTKTRRKKGEALPPMTAEQKALMEKFLPVARLVINSENKKFLRPTRGREVSVAFDQRDFNYDDLYSAGIDGLINAVHNLDCSLHNEQQKAYVALKVRGYIYDYHRIMFFYGAIDPVTGKQVKGRRKPQRRSIVDACQLTSHNADYAQVIVTEDVMVDDDSDPAKEQDHIDAFERMIRPLSEQNKHIYRLYFLYDYTMKEIGKIVGMSESRISQIFAYNNRVLHEYLSTQLNEVLD